MNLNKFWKAFSLTELLIVVVVIAVLFSAMLPIMTKRRNSSTTGNEPVWQYVNGEQKDAFYDRNVPALSSAAYFGVDPANVSDASSYASKVIIRANKNQHHLQFRYGTANGSLTGLFAMDNKGNTLGTGKLTGDSNENLNAILSRASNTSNTALGNGAFAHIKQASGVTSVGANSSMGSSSISSLTANTTAIGAGANQYGRTPDSVVIGSNAMKSPGDTIANTVALGAGTLGLPGIVAKSNAVMAGPMTASVGSYGSGDVILGSNYVGSSTDSGHNVIIGYGAYDNGPEKSSYITAIGYQACNSLGTNPKDSSSASKSRANGTPSRKTCIGNSSGATFGPAENSTMNLGWDSDDLDHIFLGGAPQYQAVAGRSALEVHNVARKANVPDGKGYLTDYNIASSTYHPGGSKPDMAPTVVMNSNLVVRGNVYFPTIDGKLRSHSLMVASPSGKTETGADRCDRKCWSRFGRKKWRGGQCGSFFHDFFNMLGTVGTIVLCSAFAILVIGGVSGAVVYSISAVNAMQGANGERPVDSITANAIVNSYATDSNVCASYDNNSFQNYPHSASGKGFKGCPDLNLGLSDLRLKENLALNNDGIEKLLLIMPYDYTFKADKTAKPQVGVMAQDLRVYFPNSVAKGNDGYLNIRLDEMFFASINTIKNLDKVVQNLETDLDVLETDTSKLAKANKSTQKRINSINKRLKKLEK